MVKEGSPKHRYELFSEYKQNRKVKEDDPKFQEKYMELMGFKEKVDEAVAFSLKNLEVTVLRHPKLEADDVIANYARFLSEKGEEVVVVSNDKDFAQLLWEGHETVSVWDPGTKEFFSKPSVNPMVVKALTGDKSDNIPGIPGYGPKKAEKAASDEEFSRMYADNGELAAEFKRNLSLIEFAKMADEDWYRVEMMRGKWDPAAIMIDFHTYGFSTLVKEKALQSYYDTFGEMVPAKLPVQTR